MQDPAQLKMMLDNIQSQLASVSMLAGQAAQPSFPVAPQVLPSLQPNDVKELVNQIMDARDAKVAAEALRAQQNAGAVPPVQTAVTSPSAQVPQKPLIPSGSPIEAVLAMIGPAFTEQQQVWLSKPQNLMGLPGFLMSKDGKALLVMALETYQQFLGGGD